MEEKNQVEITRTKLEILDQYSDDIVRIINIAKFGDRAQYKAMSTPIKGQAETHLCTRARHMRQAADIGKEIAKRLELNDRVIEIGMLMHDAGHTFTGHEGEVILDSFGEINNYGFFHHNAKGVNTVLSEDILGKVIKLIPEAGNNPELKKQIEEEFFYYLDVVVSHDGETTKEDEAAQQAEKEKRDSNEPTSISMKERVMAKVKEANVKKGKYKFFSETPEGSIAKPADILSYLRSDMIDAYRLGYIKSLDDEYLQHIGRILFYEEKDEKTRTTKLKKMVEDIKWKHIFENDKDNQIPEELKQDVTRIIDELKKKNIDTYNIDNCTNAQKGETIKIIDKELNKIQERNLKNGKGTQETYAYINKVRECTRKIVKPKKSGIEEIMTLVQEKAIDNYVENTKKTNKMGFSEEMQEAILDFRNLNYRRFAKHNKRKYQEETLPEAVWKLIDETANTLIKSGAIRDQFYDSEVKKQITNKEVNKYLKCPERPEKQYYANKRRNKIGQLPKVYKFKRFDGITRFINKTKDSSMKRKFYQDVYNYTIKQKERFARACEDVYESIPNTIKSMTEKATNPGYNPVSVMEKKAVYKTRQELRTEFGEFKHKAAISKQNLDKYIERNTEKERQQLERKVALYMATEYIGGMTDEGIIELLIKVGKLNKSTIEKQRTREVPKKNHESDEDKKKREIREFKERLSREEAPLIVFDENGYDERI